MTKANKVLFITQEITPYVSETEMSLIGRHLPQAIQERGREIRTFMPKWGNINERRNQLHEVIRLSGMNLIIDDTDHPLIIKVASIQSARMQVYFIDNDDYFQNRLQIHDENGNEYEDNDARTIFYARGVLETVKKLRWCPEIIHCHGWLTALAPLYIKKAYKEEPSFRTSKVVFSLYEEDFKQPFTAITLPNYCLRALQRKTLLIWKSLSLMLPSANWPSTIPMVSSNRARTSMRRFWNMHANPVSHSCHTKHRSNLLMHAMNSTIKFGKQKNNKITKNYK